MEGVELLVHVSAPVRRQDDQRFLDVAQSIINFEPATLIGPTDAKTSAPCEIRQDSFSHGQLLSSSPRADGDGSHSPTPGAVSAFHPMSKSNSTRLFRSNINEAFRRTSSKNLNPTYKNPYHRPPLPGKPRLSYETPDGSRRSQTAPEKLSGTVQVPRTGGTLRRVHSDSISFSSLASHISNSQLSARRELQEDATSTAVPSSSWLGAGGAEHQRGIIRTLSQTSLDDVEQSQKRRKLPRPYEAGVKRIPRPANSEAFLLLDRSQDWTSSPQTSQAQSPSSISTATPSQPLRDQHTNMEEPQNASSPVILISSGSSKQAYATSLQTVDLLSSSESQLFERTSHTSSVQEDSQITDSRRSVFEVLGLQQIISAPQPGVGEERFVTHISCPLQDFAKQLPFARFFRPIEVTRDIRVLERGYWLLEIRIVAEEVAEAARSAEKDKIQGHSMQERFQGATTAERLLKYDEAKRDGSLYQSGQSAELRAQGLWTENELVQFWKSFSSFIENSKAGWGTRLVGEDVSDESGEVVMVRIRIFTWGEVLGHIYLALWVLSDKLAARIPMHWIASDGTHVVRMAGTRSGRGSLLPWMRKGPEGEKGCWGIAFAGLD